MPMGFYGHDGTTWRQVDPAEGLHFKDGGTWREAQEAYYNDGGTWRQVYQKSDPVTYYFNPVSMDSWRPSSWRGASNLRVGSYDFGDHWLLMDFTTATDTGGSGLTLGAALAARPAVQSCELELARTTGGSSTINAGTYYISYNTGGYTTGTPTNEATYRSTHSLSSAGWAYNTSRTFTGLGNLATVLDTNELCVANNLSPVYPGGQDSDYTNIDSSTSAHTLTVTLDYA